MSSNIFGFEKILDVKWTLDEEHGGGFKLPEPTGNLFAEEFSLETKNDNARKLKAILKEVLKRPQTNNELYEIVLRNEFLPKHANEILRDMQQNNPRFTVINIATGKNARKNSFYLSYQHYKEEPIVKMYVEL